MISEKKYTSFGEHLRSLREEANLSLREVAEKFEMDASLLAKIERNERPPSRLLITKIVIHFNQDQQTLLAEYISDVIAYKIVEEEVDLNILNIVRDKVIHYRQTPPEEQ